MKKEFKKISALFLATSILFISCSEDAVSTDTNALSPKTVTVNYQNKGDLKLIEVKNIKDFAANHVLITREIAYLMADENLNLDENFETELGQAKSQDDMKMVLDKYGMKNVDAFINYNKLAQTNYEQLMMNDQSFSKLPQKDQIASVQIEIGNQHDLLPEIQFPIDTDAVGKCEKTYYKAYHACEGYYGIALGTSCVLGFFTGGVGGLIGIGSAIASFEYCVHNAKVDLNDCRQGN
jgi:hypothetical protein